MSAVPARGGWSTAAPGNGRPSSATPSRPTGQQQFLAMRASSANHAPLRSSVSHSDASVVNGGRHSFESSNRPQQPPYSYSPAPNRERATLAQLNGLMPGGSHSESNFTANPRQPSTPSRVAQLQQRPPSSRNVNGSSLQLLTTAEGRAYHMNTATGKGSWAPSSQNSQQITPSAVAPPQGQALPRAPVSSKSGGGSETHPLLRSVLFAQDHNERIYHARALSDTLKDDSVARMSLCNVEALTAFLRMLQFEIPADEAFLLLTCLAHLLIEESAQICCVSISFCIPMLIQRASKWAQVSNQHHPNICFATLANLCLQDDGCSACARAGVFRCLSSAFSAQQDSSSHHYCMRVLSSLLCNSACAATIMRHDDLLPNFFKSTLADGALQNGEVAESAAIVLRSLYEACR